MKVATLLNLSIAAFRQKFLGICPEEHLADLTSDSFAYLTGILKEAFSACGTAALKAYLESCDEPGDDLPTAAGKVRFKMACEKEYPTPFGWIAVSRRLYQADS